MLSWQLYFFVVLVWSLFGVMAFVENRETFRKSWATGHHFRVLIWGLIHGPCIWLFYFVKLLTKLFLITHYWVLQVDPEEIKK